MLDPAIERVLPTARRLVLCTSSTCPTLLGMTLAPFGQIRDGAGTVLGLALLSDDGSALAVAVSDLHPEQCNALAGHLTRGVAKSVQIDVYTTAPASEVQLGMHVGLSTTNAIARTTGVPRTAIFSNLAAAFVARAELANLHAVLWVCPSTSMDLRHSAEVGAQLQRMLEDILQTTSQAGRGALTWDQLRRSSQWHSQGDLYT